VTPSKRRIYLDHAATTPVRDDAIAAMMPHLGTYGYNPSSLHAEGRTARAALDGARASVAHVLGARPREIVFTGGGSEADNLAIIGAARARRRAGRGDRVVTVATEHRAVLHATDALRGEGFTVEVLPVDAEGRVDVARFEAALLPRTALATVMLANNELGTLQPVAALARIAHDCGVTFHTDAVQAPGRVTLDVDALGIDMLALSAHKFYGPKGVGALYVRSGTPLEALVVGGGQELGLRAGTENVAGIVGFARALELAVAELPAEAARLATLRDRLEAGIQKTLRGVRFNGAGAERLPNMTSVAFEGTDARALLISLDLAGVACSQGSACAAGAAEPSHVLAAIAAPAWAEAGTLRLSLGKLTSEEDVEAVLEMLPSVVAAARDDGRALGTSHFGSLSSRAEVRS